ncbi:MAG: hypothetical protein CML68_20225 [Rhodobacteraceae bacterium]|nr:hypothetical protein [Paracoccaceae bacterium]
MSLDDFVAAYGPVRLYRHDFLNAADTEALAERLPLGVSLDQVRVRQRLMRLVSSPEALEAANAGDCAPDGDFADGREAAVIRALEEAGYHSAVQIAQKAPTAFVADVGAAMPGGDAAAAELHARALRRRNAALNTVQGFRANLAAPYARSMPTQNIADEAVNVLEAVPSYQDLFGALNYLDTEDCNTIFSPGAYFLDVMRVIDTYITARNKIPKQLQLRARRPDLFMRKLDCDNTTTLRPYLQIVTEILGGAVKTASGKAAPEEVVAGAVYPFGLPFNEPLSAITRRLERIGTTLRSVYAAFDAPPGGGTARTSRIAVARAGLGLGPELYEILIAPQQTVPQLKTAFGLTAAADLDDLATVSTFLEKTGLTRSDLTELLTQGTSPAEQADGVPDHFYINATGESLPAMAIVIDKSDPKKPFQKIVNTSVKRWDRINRFLRLEPHVPGGFADLDWAMKATGADVLKPGTIRGLDTTMALARATQLPRDELTALWHDTKPYGKGDGPVPSDLFDRVFNNPRLLDGPSARLHPNETYVWTIAGKEEPDTTFRHRLTAALGISSDELTVLAGYVQALTGAKGKTLDLTLASLSLMYRLVRLAGLTGAGLDGLYSLLGLMYYPKSPPTTPPQNAVRFTPETVTEILATATDAAAVAMDAATLRYVATGQAASSVQTRYQVQTLTNLNARLAEAGQSLRLVPQDFRTGTIDAERADAIHRGLVKAKQISAIGLVLTPASRFKDISTLVPLARTAFVSEALIDATQSGQAIDALRDKGYLEPGPGKSSLLAVGWKRGTDLEFLFAGDPKAAEMRARVAEVLDRTRGDIGTVRETLDTARAAQRNQAATGLADLLDVGTARIDALLPLASGKNNAFALVAALLTPGTGVLAVITSAVALLSRLCILFDALDFTDRRVEAVLAAGEVFGIADVGKPGLSDILALASFGRLVRQLGDVNDVLLRCWFGIAVDGPACVGTDVEALASLTGWPAEQIETLIADFWPTSGQKPEPQKTLAGVLALARVFDLCATARMDLDGICAVADVSKLQLKGVRSQRAKVWAAYETASRAVGAAMAARLGATAFDTADREVEGELLAERRTAFVGYMIWHYGQTTDLNFIRTADDLSNHLLIDVQEGGVDNISYIAQGIASLQSYLQRVRLNLEPGVDDVPIPSAWWSWLGAYRVWEANRRIFLYPENYVDPELLTGASPIYTAFRDELGQNAVDAAHVKEAFEGYFASLGQLANLFHCSGYLDHREDPIQGGTVAELMLVGRTATEPYVYHTRTWEPDSGRWFPWQRVDLAISADAAAPVHAFGRPFLFWSELTTENGSLVEDGTAKPTSVSRASLRFSFQEANGKWIQPQSLIEDHVTEALPPSRNTPDIDKGGWGNFFNPDQLGWHAPYALKIDRGLTGSGRLTVDKGSVIAHGEETMFQREIKKGDVIRCAGQERVVDAVDPKKVELIVTEAWSESVRSARYTIQPADPLVAGFEPYECGFKVTTANPAAHSMPGSLVPVDETDTFIGQLNIGDKVTVGNESRLVLKVEAQTVTVDRAWTTPKTDLTLEITPRQDGRERIMVLFGSDADLLKSASTINPKPLENPQRDAFIAAQNAASLNAAGVSELSRGRFLITPTWMTGGLFGHISMGGAFMMTDTLEVARGRVMSLHWDWAENPDGPPRQPFRAQLDRNNELLHVRVSNDALADNCWGNSAPGYALSPADGTGGRVILYSVPGATSSLVQVANQVGWTIFGTESETFLARATQPGLRPLSEIVTLSPFPVSAFSADNWIAAAGRYSMHVVNPNEVKYGFARLSTSVVDRLNAILFGKGLDALLDLSSQEMREQPFTRFYTKGGTEPGPALDTAHLPADTMDFNGAMGLYFWELFYHNVSLVAQRLNANQRFEEAKLWYEYIFDPTASDDRDAPSPSDRYWRFRPFRNMTLQTLVEILTDRAQIAAYNDTPFDPDAIARLRPGAYAKTTVMRYIDNLIGWGDQLFTQDTRESITQATNLYNLAQSLLGPRPDDLGPFPRRKPLSYDEIAEAYDTSGTAAGGTRTTLVMGANASDLDGFYDTLTLQITGGTGGGQIRMIDSYDGASRSATVSRPWDIPPDETSTYRVLGVPQFYIDIENGPVGLATAELSDAPFNDISSYFQVPENAEFIGYWDLVEDRLFKIRHSMNIEGVVRTLALFAPPIDPRALQQAAAAGGVAGAGGFLAEPAIPNYRFGVMIEKARGLVATVSGFGAAVLSALEKRDAEALSALRAGQEVAIQDLTVGIRERQVEDLIAAQAGLSAARDGAMARREYYQGLISEELNSGEQTNLDAMTAAVVFNSLAVVARTAASIGYAVPQVGSPFAMTYGGQQVGNALTAVAGAFEIGSTISNFVAQRSLTIAGYDRREQEWTNQKTIADYDLAQAENNIALNAIRLDIAQAELEAQKVRLANAGAVDAMLQRKFTNEQLYSWMAKRLSTVFFDAHALATQLAAQAERAYQFELGRTDRILQGGTWDSLHQGLTAGEQLMMGINRLDAAYLEANKRPMEIERTIPLSELDPKALLELKTTGVCQFAFPERLFDLDYPGHYMRRIASVSVTIPAVVGPYQNLKATLTQLSNQVVLKPDPAAVAFLLEGGAVPPAGSLRSDWWPNQKVALSRGTSDSGVFELNFGDARYLPFENTGAVSSWRLSLPRETNLFDFDAISDVIVTLRYRAFDGGDGFRDQVTANPALKTRDGGGLLPLAQMFPTAWTAFLSTVQEGTQAIRFAVPAGIVPPHVGKPEVSGAVVQLALAEGVKLPARAGFADLVLDDGTNGTLALDFGGVGFAMPKLDKPVPLEQVLTGERRIAFDLKKVPPVLLDNGRIDPKKLIGINLVLTYRGQMDWKG